MEQWLVTTVGPGQFPAEYAVGGMQYNGKPFSLFAPAEAVQPPQGGSGQGLLRVQVVERKGDLALVKLPAQTFENGQYITVNVSELRPAPAPERVA
jgi:hypothetical protein